MIIELIIVYSIFGFIWLLWKSGSKIVHRYFLMNKYKTIIEMMDYFLDKSYNLIYSDQIIAYTASGFTKIQKEELETIERNFIKLSFDLMGPDNQWMAESFFGGRQYMIENMLIYIRARLEKDQIAKLFNDNIQGMKHE